MSHDCDYPLLNELTDPKLQAQAYLHASQCTYCLDHLLTLEYAILSSKREQGEPVATDLTAIDVLAERYVIQPDESTLSQVAKLLNNKADFFYFQRLVEYLADQKKNKKVRGLSLPKNLYQYVMSELEQSSIQTKSKVDLVGKIFIRIGKSFHLASEAAANIFRLPELTESIVMRSSVTALNSARFYSPVQVLPTTTGQKQGRVLYQIVQDSPSSVMLALQLEDVYPVTQVIEIKRDGRMIHSHQLKDDYVSFSQLWAGSYKVDLKDQEGNSIKQVELDIALDEDQ